jgi:hypothetical protein
MHNMNRRKYQRKAAVFKGGCGGSWFLIAILKLLAEQPSPSHRHDLLTSLLLSQRGSKADHHFQEVDLGCTGRLITRCEPPSKDRESTRWTVNTSTQLTDRRTNMRLSTFLNILITPTATAYANGHYKGKPHKTAIYSLECKGNSQNYHMRRIHGNEQYVQR